MKKTVVFDFDGVIHSYTNGWKGEDVIPDQPVEGIADSIQEIREAGYEVAVVSTRCASPKGMEAVKQYLADNEIVVDKVCKEKPPAIVYIDDRAICFDGRSDELLEKIKSFKPWYQKNNQAATNFESKTSEREKLLDLINQALLVMKPNFTFEALTDYLLENGVIVPPCKVHDLVYDLVLCDDKKYRIFDMRVGKVVPFGSNYNDDVWNVYLIGTYTYAYRSFYDFGKTVFLTREEAEKALKEREANG